MFLVDTHTHLYAEEFNEDRDLVISEALKLGINAFYLPNIDSTSIESMLELELKYPKNCFAMMGLHPCSVNANYQNELNVVKTWLKKRKFIAIGEIGVDLYWDKSFLREQLYVLNEQIDLANEYNLPIVIHCRDAFDELLNELQSRNQLPNGIFHCFSGTLEEAKKILDLGNFKLGIGGVLTFKNSGLDVVVKELGIDHLVLETDAPYLAPAPHRGKRNEAAYLHIIARKLAELLQLPMDAVMEKTSTNAELIFGNCG